MTPSPVGLDVVAIGDSGNSFCKTRHTGKICKLNPGDPVVRLDHSGEEHQSNCGKLNRNTMGLADGPLAAVGPKWKRHYITHRQFSCRTDASDREATMTLRNPSAGVVGSKEESGTNIFWFEKKWPKAAEVALHGGARWCRHFVNSYPHSLACTVPFSFA